ncbi:MULTISPECIES: hypothetical protein [Nocardiopsis]|uniref:Uncharacterized protein n=1 Tax=Nocardiopsis changdeensis TaxID=2831969 RepID=A0ABX8BZ12_9ACTN|nr:MULTISPECIES: hypothetical protein [Nocardiopsis]QUX26377.1 hypothetical protein KGD84_32270 [Nocardiopsis changdeensis]QYX40803.1 hypothetical protein K1J57_32905 [Nocardiopsis sp. MT53]
MGALPDPASPIPGTHNHRRTPEAAPPLRAVPGPRPTAPDAEPTTPSQAPPAPPTPAPAPEPPAPEPAAPASDVPQGTPEQDGAQGEDARGLDLDRIAALRAWAAEHLRPPDLLNEATPGLKQLWEDALRGDHLPANPVVRVAEIARLVVALPVMAAAVLLAWSMVSAARTAALLLGAAALWIVLGSLAGAITDLL